MTLEMVSVLVSGVNLKTFEGWGTAVGAGAVRFAVSKGLIQDMANAIRNSDEAPEYSIHKDWIIEQPAVFDEARPRGWMSVGARRRLEEWQGYR